MPAVYRSDQLTRAELNSNWLIPEKKKSLYSGFVMPVELGEQAVKLPVMQVDTNVYICYLDYRRPDLLRAGAEPNADLVAGLPEKPQLLIDAPSQKSGPEMDIVTGLVKNKLNDPTINRMTFRGGKESDLKDQGVEQIVFGKDEAGQETEFWTGVNRCIERLSIYIGW